MNNQKRIFIVAGEPSGDQHAADYIREHSSINPNINFDAFGQNEIEKTNAKIIYDTEKISVIGIIEVISKYKEILNALKVAKDYIKKNKYYIFDGRFLVKSSLEGKLVKCNSSDLVLTDSKNPFYEYGHWINNTIPYLETLEGKTIKPHLNIINQNSKINDRENGCFSLYLLNRILV